MKRLRQFGTRAGDRAVRGGASDVGLRVGSDAGLVGRQHRMVRRMRFFLLRQATWR
jgi:hypothetical protein